MGQNNFLRQASFYLLLLISLTAYFFIGYTVSISNFYAITGLYGILFAAYFLLIRHPLSKKNILIGIGAAILFRLVLLMVVPNLSDDYFRYLWDGRALAHDMNPFTILPCHFVNTVAVRQAKIDLNLFVNINSPNYYTTYPPFLQYIFAFAYFLFHKYITGNLIIFRIFIILAETGTIFLLIKLLQQFGLSKEKVLLYALNPLVIVELTGSLHFEALMLFWLVLAMWLLLKNKPVWILSAICYGLAIATKLIPLIFLPFFITRFGWKKSLYYFLVAGLTAFALYIPFLGLAPVKCMGKGLALFFNHLEFNASLYYLVHWIAAHVAGHRIVAKVGTLLAILAFVLIMSLVYSENQPSKESIFKMMLFALGIYLLCATTVHPWYIAALVLFSIFTPYRFALIWSCLIVLSYSAFRTYPYHDSMIFTTIEYLVVMAVAAYELFILPAKTIN